MVLCSSVFVLGVFVFDTRKRIERDTETVMEKLLEYLQPKTLNKFSYVAVICWILSGGTLFGIFADTENSESRFDFRCRGAKSENIDFVRGKCFQIYDETYNKFAIPVYGFVIVNFFLIGIVCVIYSQIVKSRVDDLLEKLKSNPNGDAERQSPDQENPTRRPQRRKLFTAYCCQLSARLVLGILFIVLQTQLLYPSNFPSNFNCYLTSEGNQPRNSSATGQNSTTLHECHNHRTKLRDSVFRKRDGNAKLVISVMFPRGGNGKSTYIGWNCHVSVVFPERKCLVMFPLHFWVRIYVVVCFRYVSSYGFKQSFLSILNFIIKSQELFNKTKTCLPRGGNGKSTYWLELSCFRRVS